MTPEGLFVFSISLIMNGVGYIELYVFRLDSVGYVHSTSFRQEQETVILI
jgi:hypothetical protein